MKNAQENMELILNTERLTIRPIEPDDKKDLFAYRSDVEANKYQGWIPDSLEDAAQFIESIAEKIDIPNSWFQFVIINNESQKIIGDIGIHFFDNENKQVEIGCTLHNKYHDKGYATEALSCVIDFLFTKLKKHRIIASIDPKNTSAIQLVERIGFRKEAHFIESLWIKNQWVDDLNYALLEKEWKSKSL